MDAVSYTAQWMAAARAQESEREDALFVDPLARELAAPRGFELLSDFRLEHGLPTWTYAIADALLTQRIWMAHGRNTTYVSFTLAQAARPMTLELVPLCTYRDYHAHTHGGWPLAVTALEHGCAITAFPGAQPYRVVLDRGQFSASPRTFSWSITARYISPCSDWKSVAWSLRNGASQTTTGVRDWGKRGDDSCAGGRLGPALWP